MLKKISTASDLKIKLFIIVIAALLFLPFLGEVHLFDWDEINFAEASREMIETGDYLRVHIDYEPFYEKPPLFFWFQVLSMKLFGVNEFAARFPNAMFGIAALLILYSIGRKLFDKSFGLLWVMAYAGSILPYFYFRSGILDPLFNLFMFISVWYIYRSFEISEMKNYFFIHAGIFAGLAILVKGPVGLLLPGLTYIIFYIFRFRTSGVKIVQMLIFGIVSILTAGIWFGIEFLTNGPVFLEAFFKYQVRLLTTGDAGFSGPFYYHFLVVLIGCFPASLFIFHSFKKDKSDTSEHEDFRLIMMILMFVVLIIFSIVKTKIVHYSSMTYYPLTFLAALTAYKLLNGKMVRIRFIKYSTAVVGVFIGLLLSALALIGIFKEDIIPYVQDEFVRANLMADSVWFGFESLIGVLLIFITIYGVYLLNKKQYSTAFILLYGGTAFTLSLMLPLILPQIENYVQGAPVEFYKSLKGKDVYVKSVGFRSYADIYYSEKKKENSASGIGIQHKDIEDFLIKGDISKPAYLVTKINERDKWTKIPNLEVMFEKNGFIFMKRRK